MKIVYIAHSFAPDVSGVATVATSLALYARAKSHEVEVITYGSTSGAKRDCGNILVTEFCCGGNSVVGLWGDTKIYREYVSELTSRGVDIIVIHCAQSWCLDSLLCTEFRVSIPIVLVSHGLSCYGLPSYKQYYQLLAGFIRKNGVIVALSSRLEERTFCVDFELPSPVVISNGINLEEWRDVSPKLCRDRWGIGSRKWIVTVSNHSTVKNHQAFWDIAEEIDRRIPMVAGTIIGNSYRAERWQVGRLGVKGGCWYQCRLRSLFNKVVHLETNVPRSLVKDAICEANVLLVTSRREALPVVLLESMAASTPWVSLRLGAVEDLRGGIVVDTLAEMTEVAIGLLNDPKQGERLGAEGKSCAEENHGWDGIVEKHLALYRKVIVSSRHSL